MEKIVDIIISSYPEKLAYFPGEPLNLSGLRIDAVTAGGKTIDVTKDCTISPKTHIFAENDAEVLIKATYSADGQTFAAVLSAVKINECRENQVIAGEYDKSVAVQCNNGIFVGKKDGDVAMYRGIPFVKEQPTGKNRYKAPVGYDYSAPKDTTVREAYYFGKEAMQEGETAYPTGEDCLYLNVYKNCRDSSAKKPVMVWIHGGAYVIGGTAEPTYNLYNLAKANPDVIFATIPYRLSLLGFVDLSCLKGYTDEYKNTVNLGLLDLAEALHWLHENISAFGGDPDNVTIFGESAGGGCVSLLPLVKEARPYFTKVIAQSGTPAFTRTKEFAVAVVKKVFAELKINSIDDFFKADPAALMAANAKYGDLCTFPECDGTILPLRPFDAYAEGAAKGITLMTGCNKDEGSFWYCGVVNNDIEPVKQYFEDKYARMLSLMNEEEKEAVRSFTKDAEKDGYLQDSRFFDQFMFIGPCFRLVEAHIMGGGDVYQYYVTAESEAPYMKSAHGIEISSVFGNESSFQGPALDSLFAKSIQKMWIQFAKTGNPSLPAALSPSGKAVEWPKKTSVSGAVMQMDEYLFHAEYDLGDKIVDRKRIYPLLKYYGEKPAYF
ncbi:MAG TPA: carboxylesterase family protein [Methanocorpusculum sp.]|nr:carboxylesterase family protein [Methanocorpusculum sp.]